MPLYSFCCDSCGTGKDHLFRASDRPAEIECSECGGIAKYTISVSKYVSSTAGYTTNYATPKIGLSLHDFKCNGCGHIFEEIVDRKDGQSIEDNYECPKCNEIDCKWIPGARIDRFSEQFPYYDRGLGCWLKNKAHRKQICKERGLEPVEGDYDEDKIFSEFDNRREREEKEYNDYINKLDHSPEFKEYRRMRDQDRI